MGHRTRTKRGSLTWAWTRWACWSGAETMVKKQQLNETGNETLPVRVCGPLQAKGLRQVSDRSQHSRFLRRHFRVFQIADKHRKSKMHQEKPKTLHFNPCDLRNWLSEASQEFIEDCKASVFWTEARCVSIKPSYKGQGKCLHSRTFHTCSINQLTNSFPTAQLLLVTIFIL